MAQRQGYLTNHSLKALTPYIAFAGTIRLNLWGVTGIITNDPENITAVLSSKFDDYSLGNRVGGMLPFLREGIFTQDGAPWKRSRKVIRQQFIRIHKLVPQSLSPHVDELASELRTSGVDGQAVDLKDHFFEFTLGTTTKLLFGEDLSVLPQSDRNAFRDAFDYGSWCVGVRLRLADFSFLYNPPKFKKACKMVSDTAGYFANRALKHREEFGEDAAAAKYPFILNLWNEMKNKNYVRDQLLHIIIAGRDTTALLLTWTFFLLLRHPRVLSRLRQEILTFGPAPSGAELSREQIQKLTYLRCCLNETLRLYPQVPINVRYANKATLLPRGGGPDGRDPVLVPKGYGIGWSAYHLHRRKEIYGSDAREFKPERWESGELIKEVGVGSGFLDFHGGPRVCLGKDFALMEASYAIVKILQSFPKLRLPPGTKIEPVGAEEQDISMLVAPRGRLDVLLS